jgi:head-tail adaptor
MKTTSIGQRRHLVSFQNPGASVPDGDGGSVSSWYTLTPPTAYAKIKPATAKDLERVAAGTVLATASHVVTFPYHPGVTTVTRIVFGARVFSVTGVSNPEERNVETICVCVELLPTGLPLPLPSGGAFNPAAFLHRAFNTGVAA